jgi:maleate cis-trans isomerase
MTSPLKIGLMVPINNTTMEGELLAWLPPGTRCTTLRIPRGKGLLTADTIDSYIDGALALAATFDPAEIDIVAYGCTAAGFISGPARDASLAREIGRLTGKPVVTTARAMVEALQDAKADDIALVTPYLDGVNTQLKAFLANSEIKVRAFDSLYAADVDALGRIQPDEVDGIARRTMNDDCGALFIACSQLPTIGILDDLRNDFGKPVFSSIQATAWQMRRVLGLPAATQAPAVTA